MTLTSDALSLPGLLYASHRYKRFGRAGSAGPNMVQQITAKRSCGRGRAGRYTKMVFCVRRPLSSTRSVAKNFAVGADTLLSSGA